MIVILTVSLVGRTQNFIRGSLQQGSEPTKVNVVYMPTFNSLPTTPAPGEYVNYLGISIGILQSAVGDLDISKITIQGAGPFASLVFSPATGTGYNKTLDVQSGGSSGTGTEQLTIFSWVCSNPAVSTSMTWTAGTPFVGATITFNSASVPALAGKVKLLDLSNEGGANDGNTLFVVSTNTNGDVTDYLPGVDGLAFFYSISGAPGGNNSQTGIYTTGDRFAQTDLLISLPVSMINFSGYKNGAKNTLTWRVANEVNNRGFDVLRSTDGVNYSSIGFVNSQAPGGFTTSEVYYTFDDNSPVGKKQYYRLNQKDIDGAYKLSNIVMITGDKASILGIGGIFPNPASTLLNVIIDAPKRDKVTLIITDMTGKTVKQQQENVEIGSNTVPVDIAKLAGGSYVVRLICQSSECETALGKFNKQ